MRFLILFLVFTVSLFARENPFVPMSSIAKSTQINKKDKYFKELKFKLPNSARVLKNIEVTYQNLNGSISKKIISIDRKIDWHDELFLTKNTALHKEEPTKTVIKKDMPEMGKVYRFKNFIKFEILKKSIKITTKDVKIRDFLVSRPYKVVLDFRRDANFLTKTLKVNLPPFISIILGNHEKYYRVAIELDGQYAYQLKKSKGNFIITLR